MVSNFLYAVGNADGYISSAPLTPTGATHTTTTLDTLSPSVTVLKGTFVEGNDVVSPCFVTTTVSTSASVTLITAATGTTTGTYTFPLNPVLIGGEATALTNGSAVTSSYWNGNGVFRQANELLYSPFASVWFMAGGAFTPTGVGLSGWFLRSFDGGTTYETVVATPSSSVAAVSRAPDFVIPLANSAYAAGNVTFASGIVPLYPDSLQKVVIQNNSGVTMPSTWMVMLGPSALAY